MTRKGTFNQAAQLYDKARPHYPDALFAALIGQTRLKSGARLLEIGPGTGQATRPLAQRGYAIVAVELGQDLAAIARHKLGGYPNVTVLTGAFEDIALPSASFDLVYSATAFHWIEPAVRYAKPHDLLNAHGHLAIIHTNHVSDEAGDALHAVTQPLYSKYFPPQSEGGYFRPPRMADIQPPVFDADLFQLVDFELFPLVVDYTAAQYTDLLGTFSPELALPQAQRDAFLSEIREAVNRDLGGVARKCYAMSLAIAKKV